METVVLFVIIGVVALILIRLLLLPMRLAWKLLMNGIGGFLCLYLVNLTAGLTGISLPVNAFTAITAGALGLPGLVMLVILGWLF